jgi:hypothetical protein
METKECDRCGKHKSIENYRVQKCKNKVGEGYSYVYKTCKYCQTERFKGSLTQERRDKYAATSREKRRVNKFWAVEYKGGVCEHCGNVFHVAAFDFHHIDPSEKEMDVGLMMTRPRDYLIRELDKCILLCANCHRIHHYEI